MTSLIVMNMQVMEERRQAELRQRDADISRLEGQLAQCHIQMSDSETAVSILFIPAISLYNYDGNNKSLLS
jgi:hypothetical protein